MNEQNYRAKLGRVDYFMLGDCVKVPDNVQGFFGDENIRTSRVSMSPQGFITMKNIMNVDVCRPCLQNEALRGSIERKH
jgi:hypothetical protein